jgi:hypothetical protein
MDRTDRDTGVSVAIALTQNEKWQARAQNIANDPNCGIDRLPNDLCLNHAKSFQLC